MSKKSTKQFPNKCKLIHKSKVIIPKQIEIIHSNGNPKTRQNKSRSLARTRGLNDNVLTRTKQESPKVMQTTHTQAGRAINHRRDTFG